MYDHIDSNRFTRASQFKIRWKKHMWPYFYACIEVIVLYAIKGHASVNTVNVLYFSIFYTNELNWTSVIAFNVFILHTVDNWRWVDWFFFKSEFVTYWSNFLLKPLHYFIPTVRECYTQKHKQIDTKASFVSNAVFVVDKTVWAIRL